MAYLSAAIIIIGGIAAVVTLVLTDHPWWATWMFLAICSVSVARE